MLRRSCPLIRRFWREFYRVQNVDWSPLFSPNTNWQTQQAIDKRRVDMRTALLFHYDLDLAAVHRRIGGLHVNAHLDPKAIIHRVQNLISPRELSDLERVLTSGCPAKYNVHGTHKDFAAMLAYGNHPSLTNNVDKVRATMNKEDRKDYVLTFPAWLARFIPHLALTPQGLLIKPGKNDRLVYDGSFMKDESTVPFNHHIDLTNEPEITFGESWLKYLTTIYNLRITFPNHEIYLFDDDISGAYRQCKYHPNVISAKGFIIGSFLFIPTGQTFGDTSSPSNFEPIARAREALSSEYSKGLHTIQHYPDYIDNVEFTPPPLPGFPFAQARPDRFNPGAPPAITDTIIPTAYHMHVDDNLYAAPGIDHMKWAMRCSIAGLQGILGENEPTLRPSQPDLEKFFSHPVTYTRRQLGYTINTRTMTVSIPDDKRTNFITLIQPWSSGSPRYSFTLREGAEILGNFVSLCRVCHWGIFLFHTLYHAMNWALRNNAERLQFSAAFRDLLAKRDLFCNHPTDSSKYRFFSQRVSRTIWDCKSNTYLTPAIRQEVDFIITILSDPITYKWESPIAHLIPREHDYEVYQDACPQGAGGFSPSLDFWWSLPWPDTITKRTFLHTTDPAYISNNLLEYAAIIFGLAASIRAWESLPTQSRPTNPLLLLWTDNTAAKAWTTRIAGLKAPQGHSLARIFSHLLMFSDAGVHANHIPGDDNVIADYLSRIAITHTSATFTYLDLQIRFPWLKLSRLFQPSNELHALVCSSLLTPSVNIPTTRVPLGRIKVASITSSQRFFDTPVSKTPASLHNP
jgi:hypothetical protein